MTNTPAASLGLEKLPQLTRIRSIAPSEAIYTAICRMALEVRILTLTAKLDGLWPTRLTRLRLISDKGAIRCIGQSPYR